jgi:hypothetical protein
MKRRLPSRPNLDQLKHQARDLLNAHRVGAEDAVRRIGQAVGFVIPGVDRGKVKRDGEREFYRSGENGSWSGSWMSPCSSGPSYRR